MAETKPNGLNGKQSRFVDEYLKDFNITNSAIRAGYSKKTAHAQGSRLLKNVKIQEALAKKKKHTQKRNDLSVDMLVQQYMKIAFGDIKDIVEWDDGRIRLKPSEEVDGTIIDEIRRNDTEYGGSTTVKRSDRLKALEMLAKYTGMLDEKPQATVDVTQYINALTGNAHNVWGGGNGEGQER